MVRSKERILTVSRIRIQFERILKRMTELDILLDDNPVSLPTIMTIAQEIGGHAYEIVRQAGKQAKTEILVKAETEQNKQEIKE